jgi:large repetitive protein
MNRIIGEHGARQKPLLLLRGYLYIALVLFFGVIMAQTATAALPINVIGVEKNGDETPISTYRWVIEEDLTYRTTPGIPDPNTLALSFHRSHMPVVAQGDETWTVQWGGSQGVAGTTVTLDNTKHYYVSVLPKNPGTYSIGGAALVLGEMDVPVYLNALPLPTAQITVFVFHDNFPINNAPDLPQEQGLENFKIIVEDAGGRYGMSAGAQMMDAFGNPIGTEYDEFGNVMMMGKGYVMSDANGEAVIKNLAPGKYGIQAVPPSRSNWIQTSTIEGTILIDAWVKANEPPFFAEFGPPGWHVFFGFVRPMNDTTVLTGGSSITGQIVNLHLSRPPDVAFHAGAPFEHTTPWVGLNLGVGGRGVFAKRCNPDGTFEIPDVPPGTYQLVVWDDNLDLIFAFHGVEVLEGQGNINLGAVPVFQWFTRLEHFVFNDENENGMWDGDEMPMMEQAVNLRWRDGTMYQSMPTDGEGFVPFDEIFPFFSWLVAEVDFARYKATGVTVVVDDGGAIPDSDWSFGGQLNPQPQPENGGLLYRVETGPVLTEAFQGFLGQTSVMMWGKKAYDAGENGGISGMVFYSTTRAEDDPAYGTAEPWEPGIPNVRVNLYQVIYENGNPVRGPLVSTTTTDSWDDSVPTGCPGDPLDPFYNGGRCYDGMRNWNQVRPGVFDGGYAFTEYYPGGITVDDLGNITPEAPGEVAIPLASGQYVIEVVPPQGYEIVKSQDKNVDFGDEYEKAPQKSDPQLLPPQCFGAKYEVPDELTLFPGVPAPKAGEFLNLCDQKLVNLNCGANAAADFFLFTHTPIAGHIVGFILDDTANEFDPNSPQFGEKYAPPWLPVGIYDWTGRLIGQAYSDEWGRYNAMVPSTYTENLPQPSGISPNMITTCMNDSNADPLGIYNSQYSTFCYTFQYMPGATTYLDTPVIPVAAFAGPDQFALDCEFPDGTPVIKEVTNGPFVSGGGSSIEIVSEGLRQVPNPDYCNDLVTACPDGADTVNVTIPRDYGFGGTAGTAKLVAANGREYPLTIKWWASERITATLPTRIIGNGASYQLVITRANGLSTIRGITVQVGMPLGTTFRLVMNGESVQAAIDDANPGDLILVAPGTYNESVIMWKPVNLQGWGAGSVIINAVKGVQAEKLVLWREKVKQLIVNELVDLVPGQEMGFGGVEPDTLFTEEGAGILVLAKAPEEGRWTSLPKHRIDGFTIRGSDQGGGIVVNGYADYLQISNNRIINNSGFFGGGIRLGHPQLTAEEGGNVVNSDANNHFIRIHNNHITQNGGLGGAGGGVSLCTGSDNYSLTENYICGNFTLGHGGGIGHMGLSNNGRIERNAVLFNESFNQGMTVVGGGLFIGSQAPHPGSLSPGSGNVTVNANLIQGNAAEAGDGGGIAVRRSNGQDVADNSTMSTRWYNINIFNNMIVNNVAALAGGGISLYDGARVNILHNTVAHNDSTATAGEAFTPGEPNTSIAQPAGIVSRAHSPELAGLTVAGDFSNPQLTNNIIWKNRSFYFTGDPTADPPVYALQPATPAFWDLGVLGNGGSLNPTYSIFTDTTGYDGTNISADPLFVFPYFNAARGTTVAPGEPTTALQTTVAFDEGGNFIKVRFGPLTRCDDETPGDGVPGDCSDYHITGGSPAVGEGVNLTPAYLDLRWDYDHDFRTAPVDIGADEVF